MDKEIKSPVKETPTIGSNWRDFCSVLQQLVVEGCYRQRPSCESLCSSFVWVNLIEVNLRQIAVKLRYDLTARV